MRIGDSIIMVASSDFRGAIPGCLYVYVTDTDTVYRKAVNAGAKVIEEPSVMPYGDYRATVEDPWGNLWQIATAMHKR